MCLLNMSERVQYCAHGLSPSSRQPLKRQTHAMKDYKPEERDPCKALSGSQPKDQWLRHINMVLMPAQPEHAGQKLTRCCGSGFNTTVASSECSVLRYAKRSCSCNFSSRCLQVTKSHTISRQRSVCRASHKILAVILAGFSDWQRICLGYCLLLIMEYKCSANAVPMLR